MASPCLNGPVGDLQLESQMALMIEGNEEALEASGFFYNSAPFSSTIILLSLAEVHKAVPSS